jgi:hypothetical protein
MYPTRPSDRRRRRARLQPEALETRNLMTSGAGNTFAIMNETFASAGQKLVVPFTYQPSLMTLNAKHQITLGIDVASQSGSTAKGKIVGVEDLQTHKMIPMTRANYVKTVQLANPANGKQATAVTVTLKLTAAQAASPHNYAVVVQSQGGTTGAFLVGFYLPGDTAGTGTVSNSDLTTIKQDMNVNASSQNYVFAADSNRDGVINNTDQRIAQQNLGASVKVTPVVAATLSPVSDSGLQDRITNIQTITFGGTATPGATVTYTDTDNTAPTTTATADAAGNYTLQIPLGAGANTFKVTSSDAFGQVISGQISPVTYSLTAPPAPTPTAPSNTPSVNLTGSSGGTPTTG